MARTLENSAGGYAVPDFGRQSNCERFGMGFSPFRRREHSRVRWRRSRLQLRYVICYSAERQQVAISLSTAQQPF